jgi:hypothetical protein
MSAAVSRFLQSRGAAWALGVATPPFMLFFDPVVFRSSMLGPALLGRYRPGCYVAIAAGVVAFMALLTAGRPKAFLAGVMIAAAGFGIVLGLAILPFSLLGILVMGIGLLGLSPFVTAVVFAAWSRRALAEGVGRFRLAQAIAGAVCFMATCGGAQLAASHVLQASVDDIVSGRLRKQRAAEQRLSRWQVLLDMDQFVAEWQRLSDPAAKQRLSDSFKAVTGEDLETRASRMAD